MVKFMALAAHTLLSSTAATSTTPTLQLGTKVGRTNPNYASFNVDSSYNRGFFHMNFTNPNLLAATASLAPATIRFGGTGNDYLFYDCQTVPGRDNDFYGCLNDTHRSNLLALATDTGNDFLFGISFDMEAACATNDSSYVWSSNPTRVLLSKLSEAKQTVWGFELGNEVNNRAGSDSHGACNLIPKQQSDAMLLLSDVLKEYYPNIKERPKFVGPDTGYKDAPNWLNATLSSAGSRLYAVTHHVYPGIHRDNFNSPDALDRVLNGDLKWYPPILREHAPNAQMWAGEDGPTSGGESGTCSGTEGDPHNVSACGFYATVLWYADDLALRASHGFKQYQRQDLVGGRYSLLGTQHDNEYEPYSAAITIHPDFWITFMWKRAVGLNVLSVLLSESTPKTIRAYAHCGAPPSKHPVPDYLNKSAVSSSVTLILINIDNVTTTTMEVDGVTSSSSWTLTPGAGGPFNAGALLNGQTLPTEIADGRPIESVPVVGVMRKDGKLTLPPLSVSFVVVQGVEAC